MKINVNGEGREVAFGTLDKVLDELGYGGARVATAVNETFVSAAARGQTELSDGDRLEIVAPRQGG